MPAPARSTFSHSHDRGVRRVLTTTDMGTVTQGPVGAGSPSVTYQWCAAFLDVFAFRLLWFSSPPVAGTSPPYRSTVMLTLLTSSTHSLSISASIRCKSLSALQAGAGDAASRAAGVGGPGRAPGFIGRWRTGTQNKSSLAVLVCRWAGWCTTPTPCPLLEPPPQAVSKPWKLQ